VSSCFEGPPSAKLPDSKFTAIKWHCRLKHKSWWKGWDTLAGNECREIEVLQEDKRIYSIEEYMRLVKNYRDITK
jgi:hypothetical protein